MKKLKILLVEDSEEDAFLIRETFEDRNFLKVLYHVVNGVEAIKFLNKNDPYKDVETPDLILMDINMPVMDGHQALEKIKSDDSFSHIPILMLTTSSRKEDIINAYKNHTSSYIVKPDNIYELDDIADIIKKYWNNTVKLPSRN